MILVVDNNEERRKDTITWLRVNGIMSSGTNFSELPYYTKPFMTVYVNPTSSEASRTQNSEQTLSVFICDRPSVKLPSWSINITTLKTPFLSIMNVFEEKFDHFKYNQIEIVGYACLKNDDFALGGEIIELTKQEFLIVCFFMINKNKKFKLYDAAGYFNFKNNPEENFRRAVYRINAKCKQRNRVQLIIANAYEAYFNPVIADYVCPPYEEISFETDDMKDVITININDEY